MVKNSTFIRISSRAQFIKWLLVFVMATAYPVSVQAQSQAELVRLQELFNAANALLSKGDAQQAVQKYSEAISLAPTMPLPYVNRGVAYLSLSKSSEALVDAEMALSLLSTGSHPPSHVALANLIKGAVYQNQGDYNLAIEFFSKSIVIEPSNAKFWNSRGNAYLLTKEYDKALKDYDKAIELDAALAMFYINRATVRMHLKDITASLQDLDEALKLDDTSENAYYTRGNAYVRLGKFDEGLKDYDRAISLKAKPPYFHARGRVYFILGKYDLAIKDNTAALTLDPTNIHALYNRALSYNKLGKNVLSVEDIRKAVALKEKSATMRYMLGYLHFRTSQFSLAAAEATKAIELAPQWRSPYLLRSNAYAKLGNAVKSKADRFAASKLSSGNKPVEDATFFELSIFVPEDIDQ